MTQQRLADLVRVEAKTVSLFESGAFSPTITTASLLARALGVSLPTLFEGLGKPAVAEPAEPEEVEVLDAYRGLSGEKRKAVRELLRAIR